MSTLQTADQRAAEAVVAHHTELSDTLARHLTRVLAAAERNDGSQLRDHRDELVERLRRELLPHAKAEEMILYAAAAEVPECALLVAAMREEHQSLAGLVEELSTAVSPVQVAAVARALSAVFATHLAKENDLILPRLVEDGDVSLADLLAGMHELVGVHPTHDTTGHDAHQAVNQPTPTTASCGCGGCGCTG